MTSVSPAANGLPEAPAPVIGGPQEMAPVPELQEVGAGLAEPQFTTIPAGTVSVTRAPVASCVPLLRTVRV